MCFNFSMLSQATILRTSDFTAQQLKIIYDNSDIDRLTCCAAVCASVISRILQDLPQCSGCSLICRHFSFQITFSFASRKRWIDRGWGGGTAELQKAKEGVSPRAWLPRLSATCICGQVRTGNRPQHRRGVPPLEPKSDQGLFMKFSQKRPFSLSLLLRPAVSADTLQVALWGASWRGPEPDHHHSPGLRVRRGGLMKGHETPHSEVKSRDCSNLLFRIIRG